MTSKLSTASIGARRQGVWIARFSWLLAASYWLPCAVWAELGGLPGLPLRLTNTPDIRYQSVESEPMRLTEYVNRSGVVFAVTWSGQGPVDLARLLGPYHAQYLSASAQAAAARTTLQTTSADLWMESGGHMRASFGRVVLLSACPSPCEMTRIQP